MADAADASGARKKKKKKSPSKEAEIFFPPRQTEVTSHMVLVCFGGYVCMNKVNKKGKAWEASYEFGNKT